MIAAALLLAASAQTTTGNDILSQCKEYQEPAVLYGACIGQIDGFSLGWEMSSRRNEFCRPEGATRGQLRDVVLAYIEGHPDRRHADWRFLALLALNEAWPCPNGNAVIWVPEGATIRVVPARTSK